MSLTKEYYHDHLYELHVNNLLKEGELLEGEIEYLTKFNTKKNEQTHSKHQDKKLQGDNPE